MGKAGTRDSTRRRIRRGLIGAGLFGAALAAGPALAEPPIRNAQDAACRDEARGRVFSTPNPRGLELEVLGRQIYHACMRRTKGRRR